MGLFVPPVASIPNAGHHVALLEHRVYHERIRDEIDEEVPPGMKELGRPNELCPQSAT
jgi:hypothetical protein